MLHVRCLLITLFFSSFFILLSGQNFDHQVCLKSVSFEEWDETPPKEYIEIKRDTNAIKYARPHYKQNRCDGTGKVFTKHPVGYASGTKLKVKVSFEKMCPEDIYIRGVGPDIGSRADIEFPMAIATQESNSNGNSNFVFIGISNESFESGKIRYFPNFNIKWEWAHIDANPQWISFGTSTNPLYITHDIPTAREDVYETTIHFGCTEAINLSSEEIIIEEIWDPFDLSNFSPKRFDGKIFTYWDMCKPASCSDLPCLLKAYNPDARCGALMRLLKAIYTTQGIDSFSPVTIKSTPVYKNNFMMDFANEFGDEYTSLYPFGNSARLMAVENWNVGSASHNFLKIESIKENCNQQWANNQSGIKGQGEVENPLSLHTNHVFLERGGNIYDPSYGYLKEASIIDYENENITAPSGNLVYIINNSTNNAELYYWIGVEDESGTLEVVIE